MYRRVLFIENPWYDDHFDIPTERQRIGKTLTMIASTGSDPLIGGATPGSGLLSGGSLLVGWALYEKLDSVQSLMMQWLDDSSSTPVVTASMVRTELVLFHYLLSSSACGLSNGGKCCSYKSAGIWTRDLSIASPMPCCSATTVSLSRARSAWIWWCSPVTYHNMYHGFMLLVGHGSSCPGKHQDSWSTTREGARTSDCRGPVSSCHQAAESWNLGEVLGELVGLFWSSTKVMSVNKAPRTLGAFLYLCHPTMSAKASRFRAVRPSLCSFIYLSADRYCYHDISWRMTQAISMKLNS